MNKCFKILIGVAFVLFFCMTGIGYAQLTTSLTVDGSASVEAPEAVYITNAAVKSGTDSTVHSYVDTVLKSTVNLSGSGTATVSVTVFNNTPYGYVYNGPKYVEGPDTYDNTAITFKEGITKGYELASGERVTFDVTFSYKSGAVANTVLNSAINFEFVPADEFIPEIAVKGALAKFEQILNTPADYETLTEQMSDYSNNNRANSSYVGNVVGAASEDTATLNALFTEDGENHLVLTIGGKDTNVTAMIKNENLDGVVGNEMTIYMTAEELGFRWYQSATVTVYAAVFRKNDEGKWVQYTELMTGTASANAYSGGYLSTKDSFNTDTWKSSEKYYNVNAGAQIETLVAAVPEE